MPAPDDEPSCPFCGTPLAARARTCRHCHAQRRRSAGMTPARFRLLVAAWCLLALPLMAFAAYLAALPWTRSGTPPGYALSLVGAPQAQLQPRCRVVVFDSDGQRSELTREGPCAAAGDTAPIGPGAAAPLDPAASQPGGPSAATRRLACALHSVIVLAAGALACWLLLPPLRMLLRGNGPGNWVRRVAAGTHGRVG